MAVAELFAVLRRGKKKKSINEDSPRFLKKKKNSLTSASAVFRLFN